MVVGRRLPSTSIFLNSDQIGFGSKGQKRAARGGKERTWTRPFARPRPSSTSDEGGSAVPNSRLITASRRRLSVGRFYIILISLWVRALRGCGAAAAQSESFCPKCQAYKKQRLKQLAPFAAPPPLAAGCLAANRRLLGCGCKVQVACWLLHMACFLCSVCLEPFY